MVQLVILRIQILQMVVMKLQKQSLKKIKIIQFTLLLGGGDTIALINQINAIKDFNFVSTAGGAFLEYLEGKELPGIKALKLTCQN